jgi:hypothetical protein
MQLALHKLPEGFIVTSNKKEQVEIEKLYYESDNNIPIYSFTKETLPEQYYLYEVIAQQDQIDFSEDIPKEKLREIGWFDIEKFALNYDKSKCRNFRREYTFLQTYEGVEDGIKIGFQKAQELLSDRRFTLEDMIDFSKYQEQYKENASIEDNFQTWKLKTLFQKSWKIEVEMEVNLLGKNGLDRAKLIPKFTDGKIKILKVL